MTGKDVLGGVNFASGGAGILNETGVYFVRRVAALLILQWNIYDASSDLFLSL